MRKGLQLLQATKPKSPGGCRLKHPHLLLREQMRADLLPPHLLLPQLFPPPPPQVLPDTRRLLRPSQEAGLLHIPPGQPLHQDLLIQMLGLRDHLQQYVHPLLACRPSVGRRDGNSGSSYHSLINYLVPGTVPL